MMIFPWNTEIKCPGVFIAEITNVRVPWPAFLSSISLMVLTGCPGPGDRLTPDETAQVSQQDGRVCFSITDAQDYQPADIGINPRGTPSKEKSFVFNPHLTVTNGKLCIPPSFYRFPDNGQFIIEYILTSEKHYDEPRKFVVTFAINNGYVYNVTPTEREIFLPYCRYATDAPLGACQL